MCARNEVKMDISRFNSTSTSRTLVGSDIGNDCDLVSPTTAKAPQLPIGIVQTPDNKQWIDLDYVSPKLLRELRRQYDPQSDEAKTLLAKRAARFKAWTRQTKLGFDIRLRRKIDNDHDEVTDFSLVKDDCGTLEGNVVAEMPGNAIYELPNTSTAVELPSALEDDNLSTGPAELSARPIEVKADEPLPRYEPPATPISDHRPRLQVETNSVNNENSLHGRSPSGSSIIATPTRGLSVEREDGDKGVEKQEPQNDAEVSDRTENDEISATPSASNLDEAENQAQSNTTEELHALLRALKEQLDAQNAGLKVEKNQFENLKIARKLRYETETDAEPPSPSDSKAHRASLRTFPAGRRRTTKKTSSQRSPRRKTEDIDEELPSSSALPRRQTLPKRISASAGAETAWNALLRSQAMILGPEHPLYFSAKHSQALSRVKQHRDCPPDVLDALRESENVAMQTLGKTHPRVEAFSADIDTLESLIVGKQNLPGKRLSRKGRESTSPSSSNLPSHRRGNPQSGSKSGGLLKSETPRDEVSTLPSEYSVSAFDSEIQDEAIIPTIKIPPLEDDRAEDINPETDVDDLWNTAQTPHRPRSEVVLLAGHILTGLTMVLKQGLNWLEYKYGPEPKVELGKVRVRWTCPCGEPLYDDFVETRKGAARELEAYLNRSRPKTRTGGTPTTPSSSGSRSFNGSFNSSVGGPPSTQTSWSSISQYSQGGSGGGTKRSLTASSLPPYSPFSPLTEPPWLLTCCNEERSTPKMAHLDMSPHKVTSDRDLAKALREHYFDVNRKWWKRLKLRGLTTIEFVQFECHQNRFADIRKCPDMPPHDKPYVFEPGELIPPVGSQYLLHLFKHPEEYDSELITYLRAPKRNGRLNLGVGWGINLVEGFKADRVWMLINAFFTFVSLVFAIAWACERNDIQGAFGVAQWICMLAVFTGGWIQACLG